MFRDENIPLSMIILIEDMPAAFSTATVVMTVVTWSIAVLAVMLIALSYITQFVYVLLSMLIIGISIGVSEIVIFSGIQNNVPEEITGTIQSYYNGLASGLDISVSTCNRNLGAVYWLSQYIFLNFNLFTGNNIDNYLEATNYSCP
ncbi:MAG: hypothetical protein ACYDAZ_00015 [Thermoplasmataceae archaeon]